MKLQKLFNKILKRETDLQRAYRLGFKSGKNFTCYSPYAIDANWPWLISCGDDVMISGNVRILAHDASTNKAGTSTKVGVVDIGNNVYIGYGSIILCNVRIGDNVIVGAGSVVTHDIPSNSIVAGNPAKVISSFDDWKNKHKELHKNNPICNEYKWDEWINAPEKDRTNQNNKLSKTHGYLK